MKLGEKENISTCNQRKEKIDAMCSLSTPPLHNLLQQYLSYVCAEPAISKIRDL